MASASAPRYGGSFRWGVELREQRYQSGRITLELRRAQDDPPEPRPLTVGATYVHLGIWRKEPTSATCTW